MLALSFTNAQFRSIINVLGFRSRGLNESNFHISEDESAVTTGAAMSRSYPLKSSITLARTEHSG